LSALKGSLFEQYIVNELSNLFPNLSLISRHEQGTDEGFDIHAKDSNGIDYFFEVKSSECNRLNIGQIIEYKAKLAKKFPQAKIILICKQVAPSIKELVKQIGIDIWTFSDLGISEDSITDIKEKKEKKLSPAEQKAYFALLKRGSILARTEDLSATRHISNAWAKNILSQLDKKGVAQRVGRGKYVIIPADVVYGRKSYVGDPIILVSELLKETDYFFAYYSAAHVHGLTEQMTFKTTVAVTKQTRPIRAGNISINFITLKKAKFFGIQEKTYSNVPLKVSDIDKTLIDCIDRPDLCGGLPEVARIALNTLERNQINYPQLILYLKKLDNHAVTQRVGFLIEYIAEKNAIHIPPLDELTALVGPKIYPLDVKAPKKGKISKKWKIINNTGYLEI
jgi:predicted transcriptional regulator of viral defense system